MFYPAIKQSIRDSKEVVLRLALEDNDDLPRFIAIVEKKGYSKKVLVEI